MNIWLGFVALLMGWLGTGSQVYAMDNLVAETQEVVRLYNGGDVAGVLNHFRQDGQIVTLEAGAIVGKSDIAAYLERKKIQQSSLSLSGVSQEGNAVSVESVIEKSKYLELLGVDELQLNEGARVVYEEGQIGNLEFVPPEEQIIARLRLRTLEFITWVKKFYPADAPEIASGPSGATNIKAMERTMVLLHEWAANQDRKSQ